MNSCSICHRPWILSGIARIPDCACMPKFTAAPEPAPEPPFKISYGEAPQVLFSLTPDGRLVIPPGVREEVVALIREAVAPQNRFARVDVAVDSVERLMNTDNHEIRVTLTELRAALQAERGTR